MGFELIAYDLLKRYINESIVTELKSHKIDTKDITKALCRLSKNHPERAMQCRYLRTIIDCLDKSDKNIIEQGIILNAAAFYVHRQIYESYQGVVTPYLAIPENSTLYNSLTTSLNLTLENFPDSNDLEVMYIPLVKFMQSHVYVDSDPKNGYLSKARQLFSEEKIKGYKVEKDIKDLLERVTKLKKEQIDKTREAQTKDTESKVGPGYLGIFAKANIEHPDEVISYTLKVDCN